MVHRDLYLLGLSHRTAPNTSTPTLLQPWLYLILNMPAPVLSTVHFSFSLFMTESFLILYVSAYYHIVWDAFFIILSRVGYLPILSQTRLLFTS